MRKKETLVNVPKKVGRPLKEIDKKYFENLCGLQCTKTEICSFFECGLNTLLRWCNRTYGEDFEVVYARFREQGNISLRRHQWELSEKNATMAIWLGKQYLGQKDTIVSVNVDAEEDDELTKSIKESLLEQDV